MPTLRERIKAFRNPQIGNMSPDKVHPDATPTGQRDKAKKNYVFDLFGSGAGLDYPSGDINNSKYGYAQAYLSVMAVRQAVDYYATSAMAIPSNIIRNKTGKRDDDEIIAQSDDIKREFIYYVSARDHRINYFIEPIRAMMYNAVLYDTVFVEKIRNRARRGTGFRVLNSLGMVINDQTGDITSYQYSWNNETVIFQPKEIAYTHGFNPTMDFRGSSTLQSAISKIRIENNLDRFLQSFFANNATLGLIGTPPSGDGTGMQETFNPEQMSTLRKLITDWHVGVKNSFRPLILNTPVDLDFLPIPEVNKQYDISELIQKSILTAFGVNPALIGYTDNTSYKEDLPQIEAQFVNKRLKPILSEIEQLINLELLPFLTKSDEYRFEFDYSDYQLVTEQDSLALNIRTTQLNNTGLQLNDYIEANGGERVPELEDMFVIDGVPVPLAEIPTLWQSKFGMQQATDPTMEDETDTEQDTPDSDPIQDDNMEDDPSEDTPAQGDSDKTVHVLSLDAVFQELVAWKRYVKKGKHEKTAFVPQDTRGDIADSIQLCETTADMLTGIDAQLDIVKGWQKALQANRIDFELALEDLITLARAKDITKQQFKTRLMQLVRGYSTLVFIDGLRVGGVIGEPSEDDQATIERHVVSQRQYVNNFADTLYTGGISDLEASAKPAMWFNKSISPMYDAGLASADANGMYEWVYGVAEHCDDCKALNGQRHRMKTYFSRGILPQSDLLACGGFNCKCNLIRVFASARGRLPSI